MDVHPPHIKWYYNRLLIGIDPYPYPKICFFPTDSSSKNCRSSSLGAISSCKVSALSDHFIHQYMMYRNGHPKKKTGGGLLRWLRSPEQGPRPRVTTRRYHVIRLGYTAMGKNTFCISNSSLWYRYGQLVGWLNYWKWWLSIAMWNYKRVPSWFCNCQMQHLLMEVAITIALKISTRSGQKKGYITNWKYLVGRHRPASCTPAQGQRESYRLSSS